MTKNKAFLSAMCTLVLVGCGGGSDSTPTPVNDASPEETIALTGKFIDSAVEGLTFETATQSGSTNADGEFSYVEGEQVTFSIGVMEFPTVAAKTVITPVDMSAASNDPNMTKTNIARLVQSLDQDGNPGNGITIPAASAASAEFIDFDVSTNNFANDSAVINLVANSGSVTTTLISAEKANAHLDETLQNLPSGLSPYTFWLTNENYEEEFERQKELQFYPTRVEGRCRADVPEYRGLFENFATAPISAYWTFHHLTAKDYNNLVLSLSGNEYRPIHEQNFSCAGERRYQGTWVLDY